MTRSRLAAAVMAAMTLVAPSAAAANDDLDTYVVAGTGEAGLEVRLGPGTDQPSVGILPEGTLVRVLERADVEGSGTWFGVEPPPGLALPRGFCSAFFLAPRAIQATVVGYAAGGDSGAVGGYTASGTRTHWGTVAADWRVFPPGTRLQIEGFPDVDFVVEDTGSGVRGTLIDIWFPELANALDFGTQRRRVTVQP